MPAILGAEFKRLRLAAHITQQRTGNNLYFNPSKISRLESGRSRFLESDVSKLLCQYRVPPREHPRYLAWGRSVHNPWWPDTSGGPDGGGLQHLLDLARHRLIRRYETAAIPELLQTPAYARAALSLTYPDLPDHELDLLRDARIRGQWILNTEHAPTLWLVIEEAALLRPIAESADWQAQLTHLSQLARRPRLVVQVLPTRGCGPATIDHSFTYHRFADPHLPDLACVRELTGTHCHDQPQETDRYLQAADQLAQLALSPADSLAYISALRRAA
ncbi:helix-turn-helix transcriptional regulator [Nocardia sp. 2]|uniref:Helix-turn-helix transcriptional regulator n=1 Tax=Nocardia acididurans TaxID=2802282 RepID=A0ABS1LZU1_9NOCA|nr:helix-turn-helix transcriptional regulator [Nocardia acididurans]MBL1073938.1 helix-turn-helix transcriptional regulator [Nocardia acididurans]